MWFEIEVQAAYSGLNLGLLRSSVTWRLSRQANRPKKCQWEPTKKHGIRPKIFGQALGQFDFPLVCPLLVHIYKTT